MAVAVFGAVVPEAVDEAHEAAAPVVRPRGEAHELTRLQVVVREARRVQRRDRDDAGTKQTWTIARNAKK